MKFTKKFLEYLMNFAHINPQMNFIPGKVQTTIVGAGPSSISFFARLKSNVEITDQFAIIDLWKFLHVIKLMEDPDIEVTIPGKQLIIKDKNKVINYTAHVSDLIRHAKNPEKFKKPSEGIEFSLLEKDIVSISKLSNVFKTNEIIFAGDGKKLYLETKNLDNPTTDIGRVDIGEISEIFTAVIKTSSLYNIIESNYNVTISQKGYIFFENDDLEYIIPLESKFSKF